jgi:hypothetical protein
MALVALPFLLHASAVRGWGVNMLTTDEWFYVELVRRVRSGEAWLPWLLVQHNEHRMVPYKLALVPIARYARWDNLVEMYVSFVVVCLTVLGIWRIYRRAGGTSLLAFAPVAWVMCSFLQYQNMFYGLQLTFYFTTLGVVWALALLGTETLACVVGAAFFGFVASFSTLNGMLVWPIGLALLALGRARRTHLLVWAGAAVACFTLYFHGFEMPPQTAPLSGSLKHPLDVIAFALAGLGAPLSGASTGWAQAVGFVYVALIGWLLFVTRGRPRPVATTLPLGLVLFGAVSVGIIAVGRVSTGLDQALLSRYVTFTSLGIAGTYLLLERRASSGAVPLHRSRLFLGSLGLLVLGLGAANRRGVREGRFWMKLRIRDRATIELMASAPDAVLAPLISMQSTYIPQLRDYSARMKAEGIGPYIDPPDALLVTWVPEAFAASEIVPGAAIEQHLRCPTGDLEDVAVGLAGYGRDNRGTVVLSVSAGARELGRRVVSASQIRDNTWIRISLPEPLKRCSGELLVIRVESPDASPGVATTVWTFPSYYEGELTQGGQGALAGRSLGIQLNAFSLGLIDLKAPE